MAYLYTYKIEIASITTKNTSLHTIPSAILIPAVSEATPVANGFTVDARHPICEPTKITATAVTVSNPTPIMIGIRRG